MDYKLSAKNKHGKWWTFGYFKKNQYGNLQASFKVKPELLELLRDKEGGYVNFAAFEDEGKKQDAPAKVCDAPLRPLNDLDDEMPF
jgi:hypothetical protein